MERDGTYFNKKWPNNIIAKFRDHINDWDCNERDLKELYGKDTKTFFYEDVKKNKKIL